MVEILGISLSAYFAGIVLTSFTIFVYTIILGSIIGFDKDVNAGYHSMIVLAIILLFAFGFGMGGFIVAVDYPASILLPVLAALFGGIFLATVGIGTVRLFRV